MSARRDKGISLVEVLVVVGLAGIVINMAIKIFYQMKVAQRDSIISFDDRDKRLQAKQIFKFFITNAFIDGSSTYSLWKQTYNSSGNTQINPLDYPIIYAQEAPLIAGIPSGATTGTDILLLQTIQKPQFIDSGVTTGLSSITRVLDQNSSSISDDSYLMLASDGNLNLLTADGDKTDGDTTINFINPVGHDFPSGSVLYTDYSFNIIYVADSGRVDDIGSPISSLYMQEFKSSSQGETPQELISGVGDLQINYNINGTWDPVNSAINADDAYKRIWYSEVKGVQIRYTLDGEQEEVIISFDGVGLI